MSALQKTFEKFLVASNDYVEFKKNFSKLLDSINELAKSIVNITQAIQAHHIAIGELLSFQKELSRLINNPYDYKDILDDDTKLN